MIRQRSGFEPLRGERDKTSHRVVLPSLRQRGGAGGGVRPSPSTPCTLHSPLRHTPAVRSTWTHGRLVRSARPPRAPLVHDFVRLSGSCSPRKLSLYVDSVCLSRKASSALLASWRFKSHPAPRLPRRGGAEHGGAVAGRPALGNTPAWARPWPNEAPFPRGKVPENPPAALIGLHLLCRYSVRRLPACHAGRMIHEQGSYPRRRG